MPNTVAIIQSRMGSSRYPGKMVEQLGQWPLIEWVLRRVAQATLVDQVVLATSTDAQNDPLVAHATRLGEGTYRGSENDVLSRYVDVARQTHADTVVRICGDNPLISPAEIDRVIAHFHEAKPDYAFNHIPKLDNNYVDGLGAEVLSSNLLYEIESKISEDRHREHVTLYIWDHPGQYSISTIPAPTELGHPEVRLDVDTEPDLDRLNEALGETGQFNVRPEDCNVEPIIRWLTGTGQ